jgi:hypothetical protein
MPFANNALASILGSAIREMTARGLEADLRPNQRPDIRPPASVRRDAEQIRVAEEKRARKRAKRLEHD